MAGGLGVGADHLASSHEAPKNPALGRGRLGETAWLGASISAMEAVSRKSSNVEFLLKLRVLEHRFTLGAKGFENQIQLLVRSCQRFYNGGKLFIIHVFGMITTD